MSAETEFLDRVGLRGEHLPDPAAVVGFGQARFTVLTPRLLRLEWSADGSFDDRPSYAFPNRRVSVPSFTHDIEDGSLRLSTADLTLRYVDGPFGPDNLSIDLTVGGEPIRWAPGARNMQNLRGARRTLDGCRGEASLEPGLLSRGGWSLFDDSASVRFDSRSGWVRQALDGQRYDWYFFGYGHDYRAQIADYAAFGGPVPMIPRWILGAWWSRYWAYSEQDLRKLVAEFAEHDFPLDVLVIDMDWHTPDSWTGYTWNHDLFPDPPAFLAWLHAQGLRTTLNLHPAEGVQNFEQVYPAFAKAMGIDPAHGEQVPFSIADPLFARHYFELLHHPLEAQGVDFWWMDWQQGRSSDLTGLDPLPWLNHLHYNDLRRHAERRPVVFSRWGGLGNHRYPVGFSGDTYATWESLRFQPYFTATAANVLFGWWSHDIGGHFGACEPELFARWVQLGAYSPILRLHSTKDELAERRPWAFPPDVRDAARAAFQARYELLPYLYTLARRHSDESLAPCCPPYYSHPEISDAYLAREQYELGDGLIVAPIVHPIDPASGLAPADVWVPPGEWIECGSGEIFSGPGWVRLVGDLNRVPQLIRPGSILPLGPITTRSHAQSGEHLILSVFAPGEGFFRLYEDDGLSEAYRQGEFEWTPIRLSTSPAGDRYELTIDTPEGHCPALPAERRFTLRFEHAPRPREVQLDGVAHPDWSYDEAARRISIELPPRPRGQAAAVVVSLDPAGLPLGDAHNRYLRAADARRLLGLGAEVEGTPVDNLIAAALAGDTHAHQNALARLGGPFARVYEYTTPEDASHHLGCLLVAAPHDGTPVGVSGLWRLQDSDGSHEYPFDLGEVAADTIVESPFAWDGRIATACWGLELALRWRGHELHHSFTAQTLFPTIGSWRVFARPIDEPVELAELIDEQGVPRPERPWDSYAHEPAHGGEFQNLTEHYNVPLAIYARRDRSATMVGYATAGFHSPDEREIRVAYQSYRGLRLYVNGVEVAEETHADVDFFQLNIDWSRSAPVRINAGVNHLLIISEHHAEDQAWRWFLRVALLNLDGLPLPDLAAL